MLEEKMRKLLAETGRMLLKNGLIVRTWGNVSGRTGNDSCLITPTGLDYTTMDGNDMVRIDLESGEWEGKHRPSGERGVHVAAYRELCDVDFVIHTHQGFVTAVGLAGFNDMDITDEEEKKLGGIGLADYGLPGSKELTDAVSRVLREGKHTVLMAHHGVLICGGTRDETLERAVLLEDICRRNVTVIPEDAGDHIADDANGEGVRTDIEKRLGSVCGYCSAFTTGAVSLCAEKNEDIYAQVDDMAQMIGKKIPAAKDVPQAEEKLRDNDAVLIYGVGAVVKADNADDVYALKMLTDKACLCKLHTDDRNVSALLSDDDVETMRDIYVNTYSKMKNAADK